MPKITTKKSLGNLKDSIRIYRSGGENNTSFRISDQINARKEYRKKAKELGYNNIGQSIAAIDPGTLSIVPDVFIKNK